MNSMQETEVDETLQIPDDLFLKVVRVVHESWRAWSIANGKSEDECPRYEDAPDWMIEASKASVRRVLANPEGDAADVHQAWVEEKLAAGWVYGPVKDAAATPPTHPALVPYAELPHWIRLTDVLLLDVVLALVGQDELASHQNELLLRTMKAIALAARRVAGVNGFVYLQAICGIMCDLLAQGPKPLADRILDQVGRIADESRKS